MQSGMRKRRKATLLKARGNVCRGCFERFAPDVLTIDHVIPLSRGGTHDLSNLQLMCEPCNHKKDNAYV